eukprot:CAMPEP_0206265636 /NCGR_PEP_ID=MMETSP0047_2-20121206/30119_1 /ASSEMBLY_ACC=CAM_ASM_000192 /TAXON_ID=195065 /ORGANISM="Chroomonas mesostigmatica_cf, Strain CCMP1168" /LENGTH=233 /DNA_ID=CAMNT_0053693581 /DNA_START=386 /DNA_END=1083 /DNA_ORIENTATION=-
MRYLILNDSDLREECGRDPHVIFARSAAVTRTPARTARGEVQAHARLHLAEGGRDEALEIRLADPPPCVDVDVPDDVDYLLRVVPWALALERLLDLLRRDPARITRVEEPPHLVHELGGVDSTAVPLAEEDHAELLEAHRALALKVHQLEEHLHGVLVHLRARRLKEAAETRPVEEASALVVDLVEELAQIVDKRLVHRLESLAQLRLLGLQRALVASPPPLLVQAPRTGEPP